MLKIKFYLVLFISITSFFFSQANAQSLSDLDKTTIKQTIQNQLDAFAIDDFKLAYSYAAPSIKEIFPSYLDFETMIRNSYKAVHRPKSIDFGSVQPTSSGAMMKLYLVDPDGDFITAEYNLEKKDNGIWLISSCILLKGSSDQI